LIKIGQKKGPYYPFVLQMRYSGQIKKELHFCNSFIFSAPPAVLFSHQFYDNTPKLYNVTETLAGFNPDLYRQQ